MTVTFNIHNVTNGSKSTVLLRKFFQMVFVGNDRKSLHIYTATVLGGRCSAKDTYDKKENFISDLKSFKQFCVQFDFIVTGNDNNSVLSIKNEDVTAGENGFLGQVDCIQQVWGKQSEIILGDQGKLKKKLEKFLQSSTKEGSDTDENFDQVLAKLAQSRVLWIEDENKKDSEPLMNTIAIPGRSRLEEYSIGQGEKKLDEGSEKSYYLVTMPENQECYKGIELLNWIKTTITFEYQLNDQNLNFCIKKEASDTNTRFYAPDFTWYFSPPVKSYINHEASSAEASWQRSSSPTCDDYENCQCPVKPGVAAQYTSKRYDNAINPVANKTTVNFRRWVNDEMISYRQKYRIAAKNIFSNPEHFNDIRELNIFIDTSDEHNRGNRQYVLGLFISFALSFGIDKTRLEEAQRYFPLEKLFLADTWWLSLIIVLSLNFLIRPPRNIEKKKYRAYIWWRKVNIFSALAWVIVAFCLDKSYYITELLFNLVGNRIVSFVDSLLCINVNFYLIPQIVFLLILASNIFYLIKNIKKYHDPILSSLFGDDIL